ncbi:carbon-nitrogen hydrolase family protein [Streptomyces sp. GbtcB6]|uniref:carbon-nitrogen hydrolase family protein n=1 Tax=Streptomyces sp. GbtcB6 TaxID=2824751 RepID=UPI001C30AA2C|nr:carbon-nitrogen hydrolase family protein [Streptomyces sp. GbtcB6]
MPELSELHGPRGTVRIAAAQACPVPGDVVRNVATVAASIREAAANGAQLVVFPEKFLCGYEPDLVAADPAGLAVSADDPRLDPIAEACRDSGTAAVVGAVSADGGGLAISVFVFSRAGSVAGRYDKQFLFGSETGLYRPGTRDCTLDLDGWRLGLGICYDSGFPEHAATVAADGCHAYLLSALFSVGNGYQESRTWLPDRARDNGLYVLMANHVGHTGGWHACGSSAVWGPDGTVLAEAGPEATELVYADLDPAACGATAADGASLRPALLLS